MPEPQNAVRSVIMLGASGAVGGEVVKALMAWPDLERLTLLNRRALNLPVSAALHQHIVAPLDVGTYAALLPGHTAAVCTLGVGQPSDVSKEELVRVDKTAALDFARACRTAGIRHFIILASVAADAKSNNFYLRTKGELRDGLVALGFERLSVFQPSMILTPINRYDWKQGLVLKVWPLLSPLLVGRLSRYRGIDVRTLGSAMAAVLRRDGAQVEILHWQEMHEILAGR